MLHITYLQKLQLFKGFVSSAIAWNYKSKNINLYTAITAKKEKQHFCIGLRILLNYYRVPKDK